jgi:hypothetical protein
MMIQTGGYKHIESEFTEILKEEVFTVEAVTRFSARLGTAEIAAARGV